MTQQLWGTNADGGFMYSDQLSKVLRRAVQPLTKFRQLCDADDASSKGLHAGADYHWNVYGNVSTKGNTLNETSTVPVTKFTITQGTLTVNERANSVRYTGKLDNLSLHPVTDVIDRALKDDCRKSLDAMCWAQFDACQKRVVDNGTAAITVTTNGTATATNSNALNKEHVKLISDNMKEANVPPFAMDDYASISHPSTYRTFKNDLESIHQYTDDASRGLGMIMNGEIGRYESIRFIEQNHIPKGGAADSTTFNAYTETADAWNGGNSSWAFFFGNDTVLEAIVIPEEIRGKVPGDYGRDMGIAWYYLGGAGIVHTAAAQTRIYKWDSAV